MTRESVIEAELGKRVRQGLGGYSIKLTPTVVGMPDRLVILPGGRMYLCEIKVEGGSVSAAQRSWHGALAELGVEVHVIWGRQGVIDFVRMCGERMLPPALRTPTRGKDSDDE